MCFYFFCFEQTSIGKLKGEIELSSVRAVETVDMEALGKGLFFQVHTNCCTTLCPIKNTKIVLVISSTKLNQFL